MKQFMGLDGISVKQLAKQLNTRLQSCTIDKIQQPDRYDLLITFKAQGRPRLLLSANPAFPVAFLARHRRENALQAPMFCMLLRKHLGGARLKRVEAKDYERVLRFCFSKRDELADMAERSLIVELTGRYSNIILLDENDVILDSLIHVDASRSRYREVLPARPYLPPPPQDKPHPEERLESMRQQSPEEFLKTFSEKKAERALLELCLGLSPQLAREIIWRSKIRDKISLRELSPEEAESLYRVCELFLREILSCGEQGFYYPEANRGRGDFHCLELDSPGPCIPMPSLNDAIEKVYERHIFSDQLMQKRRYLSDRVSRALQRRRKLLDAYENDIKRSENYEQKRIHGELLLTQLAQLPERVPEGGKVEIIDYYDPEQKSIVLELDPRFSVSQNANRLFKQYNKDHHTFEYATKKADETWSEIKYLESFIPLLDHAESLDALATVAEEIDRALDDKDKKKEKASRPGRKFRKEQRREQHAALPPRRYLSSDGLVILAGRNNYQNDNLTFRTAKPDDIWLHAKNRPGTHVILRLDDDGKLPQQSLLEAAEIAAWLSRSSGEKQAGGADMEIDFCPVRNVRKPRGAKPGFVLYENYNTIRAEAAEHSELRKEES